MTAKITKKNASKVMDNLAKLLKSDAGLRASLDAWLDEQLANDAFGTEGQLDPRGDHREDA